MTVLGHLWTLGHLKHDLSAGIKHIETLPAPFNRFFQEALESVFQGPALDHPGRFLFGTTPAGRSGKRDRTFRKASQHFEDVGPKPWRTNRESTREWRELEVVTRAISARPKKRVKKQKTILQEKYHKYRKAEVLRSPRRVQITMVSPPRGCGTLKG